MTNEEALMKAAGFTIDLSRYDSRFPPHGRSGEVRKLRERIVGLTKVLNAKAAQDDVDADVTAQWEALEGEISALVTGGGQ